MTNGLRTRIMLDRAIGVRKQPPKAPWTAADIGDAIVALTCAVGFVVLVL